MTTKQIALVTGDGSGPEMMAQACRVTEAAARLDGIDIEWVPTPMGWNAYEKTGDTFPKESFELATKIGTLFFGGVGDPKYDDTIGKENPAMKPEPRALLPIRKQWGLLHNFRYFYFNVLNRHQIKIRPELIPAGGVTQLWVRFLLEDSYFGNEDLRDHITLSDEMKKLLGSDRIKLHSEVTGDEEIFIDVAYYRKSTLIRYFMFCFEEARRLGMPMICVSKSNVLPRYLFWRKVCDQVAKNFPDVKLEHVIVDTACMRLFNPALLNGIIACGNEHGDILTDGASESNGSMGMMRSSAINVENGMAMFESGAGTFPQGAGQDIANPIGRILTGALLLRHIGSNKGADALEWAVKMVLAEGYRTGDIFTADDDPAKKVGCSRMGQLVLDQLAA